MKTKRQIRFPPNLQMLTYCVPLESKLIPISLWYVNNVAILGIVWNVYCQNEVDIFKNAFPPSFLSVRKSVVCTKEEKIALFHLITRYLYGK